MLPASGPLSLSQVNTELGLAANTQISLGQASVRTLAGVPSGAISFSNLHGKSSYVGGTQVTSADAGDGVLRGYKVGAYGSVTPTTIQGHVIWELLNSYTINLGWILLPHGARLTGTTVTCRNSGGTILGSWPLDAPYDDVVGTYYIWGVIPTDFLAVGTVQFVEIT